MPTGAPIAPHPTAASSRRRALVGHTRRVAGVLGFLSGGLVSGLLALAYYVTRRITQPTPPTAYDSYVMTPYELGVPFHDVSFPTVDASLLRGWWLERPDSRDVIITCGGYRGRRADLLGIGTALWRSGSNVLMFDYRGHGELAGTRVTLGYHELEDVLAAVDWVKGRVEGGRVGLIGYSMGASIAIMAAARNSAIRAVVADSAFATQRSAVSLGVRRVLHLPHGILLNAVDLLLGLVGGYHFRDVEPICDIARVAPRPLLLIHGDRDSVTSVHDTESLYAAAAEPKDMWISPGVEHCGTYFADRQVYCKRVAEFFERALAAAATEIKANSTEAPAAR